MVVQAGDKLVDKVTGKIWTIDEIKNCPETGMQVATLSSAAANNRKEPSVDCYVMTLADRYFPARPAFDVNSDLRFN